MFCVCLLTIFLIKLLLELDQAYCGICLYFHLYSHLYLMFRICVPTISLIMLLLVILSQISKQPCGSSVAWSECRIVLTGRARTPYGIHACIWILNCKICIFVFVIKIWFLFALYLDYIWCHLSLADDSIANIDHSIEGSWAPADLSQSKCFAVNLIASRPTVPLRTMWPCERPGTGRRSP